MPGFVRCRRDGILRQAVTTLTSLRAEYMEEQVHAKACAATKFLHD